ncbi:MAG: hypothetical protein H7246_15365 [Phycisphaerae bacterium]|nr:hypothetical protein [Saprospiraceae bacterium]
MEDLFKEFRDNLDRRPEPAFEEHDWQDMQARLERDGRKHPAAFAWWWMAVPFMLLLTGSNAFFFWQWKRAEQQASTLEIRRDTVFHTRVVYSTDTIYRTRVVREKVVEYQPFYAQNQADLFDTKNGLEFLVVNPSMQADNLQVPENLQLPESFKLSGSSFENKLSGSSGQTTKSERLAQNIVFLPPGDMPPLQFHRRPIKLPDYSVFVPVKKHQKSFSDHLYNARPKGYQAGISGGLAYPFGGGVDFKSGYSTGLHAALEFSPNLRLWADAVYFNTLYLSDRMGEDIGVPIEGPPSNDYIFLQAEVPQPFFQYSAGMQYLFHSKHRLKPLVGLGFGAISLLPYDVVYEFENTSLGLEWNLDKTVHQQGLVSNFLVLPLGVEYGLSKHWNGQIQARYRYNWKGAGVQSPNMLGIQGGLNYRF